MKFWFIAVLLSVVQATPPIPRQAPGPSHAVKKDSDDKQAPTASSIGPNVVATKPDKNDSKPPSKATEPESVVVRELPPETVNTSPPDEWNRAYVIFTGLLVLIGGGGVWAAHRTLRAIERQTIESVKATEAFVHSQRPIITCDPHKDSGAGWHPIFDIIENNRMRLDLFNRGQTSAFHCRQEMWIELVPHPDASFSNMEKFAFTDNAVHFAPAHSFTIYPNHGPVVINIPVGRELSQAEHSAMKSARLLVYVRLRVTYRDVFLSPAEPDRFSDFGFWVMYEGLGPLSKYQDSN